VRTHFASPSCRWGCVDFFYFFSNPHWRTDGLTEIAVYRGSALPKNMIPHKSQLFNFLSLFLTNLIILIFRLLSWHSWNYREHRRWCRFICLQHDKSNHLIVKQVQLLNTGSGTSSRLCSKSVLRNGVWNIIVKYQLAFWYQRLISFSFTTSIFWPGECGICHAELPRRLEGHLTGRCGGLSVPEISYRPKGLWIPLRR
jgi:hypothetical protein